MAAFERLPEQAHVGAVRWQISELQRSVDYYQGVLGLHHVPIALMMPRGHRSVSSVSRSPRSHTTVTLTGREIASETAMRR